jgi:hypothetical protein
MVTQDEQHPTPTKASPTSSTLDPALFKPPAQKPLLSVQPPPPEVQQSTDTPKVSSINHALLTVPQNKTTPEEQSPTPVTPAAPTLLPAISQPQADAELPETTPCIQPMNVRKRFPNNLPDELCLVTDQDGNTSSIRKESGNQYAVKVGTRYLDSCIRELALKQGLNLKKKELNDINSILKDHAERAKLYKHIWYRIAAIPGGIEIDLGDENHIRVRITAGKVKIVTSGSDTLFYRSPVSLPMVMPAETGDLKRLVKYLNVQPSESVLLIAWISYVLAHPKVATSKFPILAIISSQGSGKSSLCNTIKYIIDPNRVGLQILPSNSKDLAIAAQNSHILFYDNVRGFSQAMADILCVAATGGVISSRQLYTDSDQQLFNLHSAMVLNGIHSFITQPDLAQRCLPIQLKRIPEEQRKSEVELAQEFQADLPFIMRGLFDLIADIFTHLPTAKVTNPERMIDFVRWLAAMETAQAVPAGVYQMQYSAALRQGQLDSLQENVLAAAIFDLTENLQGGRWDGTPEELLVELTERASIGTLRSRDWPVNPISLSKRLAVLEAGLASQGIEIQFRRGKHRRITIATTLTGEI